MSPSSDVEIGYAGYQLIRNVLAAYAEGCSFCVLHDDRRPDLREAWFKVMAAVKLAELRVRLSVLAWQELAEYLPADLQEFLDWKYGTVGPGKTASSVGEPTQFD
jgi:ABC-type nitrate/sulfonate/bicarbonate transport system substrate-binding protein